MRRLQIAVVALGLALAGAASAADLTVAVDQTARLRVPGAAASVIVGNPRVADVTVVDPQTLFVNGRGYGVTQVVVLDRAGRTLYQGEVVVTAPNSGQVSVFRGAKATDMACGSTCSAVEREKKD